MCREIADRLGLELLVVRRKAGDLIDRFLQRWRNNVERYANLECVKLILPVPTASMRFCTSEAKVAVICQELVKRFPGQTIISASGIRREESPSRARAEIAEPQPKLTSKTHRTTGLNWHPILDWKVEEVFAYLQAKGLRLHEAYTRYGSSRVSCSFCVLASKADLRAAAGCADNHDVYRELVDLEIKSTFAYQPGNWLGDVAPGLLTQAARLALAEAKRKAARRASIEARIPRHLLYTKGWPTGVPTRAEAALLAEIRRKVAATVGLRIYYTTPDSIIARYCELIREREAKERAKVKAKGENKAPRAEISLFGNCTPAALPPDELIPSADSSR